jgi:hypothetical protein
VVGCEAIMKLDAAPFAGWHWLCPQSAVGLLPTWRSPHLLSTGAPTLRMTRMAGSQVSSTCTCQSSFLQGLCLVKLHTRVASGRVYGSQGSLAGWHLSLLLVTFYDSPSCPARHVLLTCLIFLPLWNPRQHCVLPLFQLLRVLHGSGWVQHGA